MRNVIDWFWLRPWAVALVIAVAVFLFSAAVANMLIMPSVEEGHRDFVNDCKDQGGKFIELSDVSYCIIDGVKVSY